jgi:hypothetical protein
MPSPRRLSPTIEAEEMSLSSKDDEPDSLIARAAEHVEDDTTPLMTQKSEELEAEPVLPEAPHPRGKDCRPPDDPSTHGPTTEMEKGEAGPLREANEVSLSERLKDEKPSEAAVAALSASSSDYSLLGALWQNSTIGVPEPLRRLTAWRWASAAPTAAPAEAPPSPSTSTSASVDEAQTPDEDEERAERRSIMSTKSTPSPTSSGRITPTAIVTDYGVIHGWVPEGFEEEFAAAMRDLEARGEVEADDGQSERSFRTAEAVVESLPGEAKLAPPPGPQRTESEEYERRSSVPPLPSSLSRPDQMRRQPSISPSVSSTFSQQSSSSSSTSKRKTKLFGLFGKSSSGGKRTSEPESEATYVSYASGRPQRQSSMSSSSRSRSTSIATSSTTTDPKVAEGEHVPAAREARPLRTILKTKDLKGRRSSRAKKVFNVRFANATRGLGLRTVAAQEAEHAGGTDHALAWVGVGRGRYGAFALDALLHKLNNRAQATWSSRAKGPRRSTPSRWRPYARNGVHSDRARRTKGAHGRPR